MTSWQQAQCIAFDQTCEHEEANEQGNLLKAMFGGAKK